MRRRLSLYPLTILAALAVAAAIFSLQPAEPAEAKIATRVSSVAITSSPSSGTTYERRETISVTVTFNEAVTVSGTPRLRLQIECNKGGTSKTCTRRAKYASGSGTAALVFTYQVKRYDKDTSGVAIKKNSIRRTGSADIYKNGTTEKVKLVHDAVAASTSHKVDGSLS